MPQVVAQQREIGVRQLRLPEQRQHAVVAIDSLTAPSARRSVLSGRDRRRSISANAARARARLQIAFMSPT
jgi:hypothetical protein